MCKRENLLKRVASVAVLAFILSGVTLPLAQIQQKPTPGVPPQVPPGKIPPQLCCIAGEYEGYHKDRVPPTKSCPKPKEGPFKMVIYQAEKCGFKIWGKVIGKEGDSQEFSGSVTPAPIKGCCNIQGLMKKPGEETNFKGTLCLKDGKWEGKGDYTTRRPREGILCPGTWQMKQK